ncbi:hypothetical protein P3T76_015619 [Phytophthora citrophthora]|uniref:Myosin-binding domain-containing protein n=1 Tax=Phytophthora citrophthora TaxID=4793 RepID=A0AAD9FYZ3_9STRA|nr:hypothetical protein P3T76_015619 [Phytophthora citrophthora]
MTHPFYRPNTVKKLMEIAVTSSSPLGQYLAELITSFLIPSLLSELDAEAGSSESLAQILSTPQPVARKRPRRSTAQTLRLWEWLQLAQTIQRRVELVAVRRLIPKLCAFHPTIREELQQTVGYNATVFAVSYKGNGWWSRYIALVEVLEGVQVTQQSVVILAVVLGSWRWDTLVLKLLQWIAAVVFVLELSMKLWLGWYARRSQQLVAALQTFLSAMSNYDQAYGDSLTLVKRAELASRGYRLGAGLLPPIGRLEASSNAESSGENGATELKKETLVEREDDKAPSLLLTALTKQRNRSTLLLENAVRTELVTNVARSCSSSMSCNLFDTLISQRVEAEQLIKALGVWTDDLQVWNSTKNPVTLQTLDSSIHPTERQQDGQQAPSDPVDPQLNSVASQLHDLRSISETFTALTIASQHELLTDAAPEQLSSS